MGLKRIVIDMFAHAPAGWVQATRLRYRALRDLVKLCRAGLQDVRSYARHSGLFDHRGKGAQQARIIKSCHSIEKGLALRAPRPGFGQPAAGQLLAATGDYLQRFGTDHALMSAAATLDEYLRFNADAGVELPHIHASTARLREALQHDEAGNGGCSTGGTREVTREAILRAARLDMDAFFRSRYSVRQFSAKPVDSALLEAAVRMAQKTPSVCNREAGRVYVIDDKAKADRLLLLQNGNRGFGDQAGKLLVITARLDCFHTVGERHQSWIDGGLFAMSLIYALHSLGFGSCCLNWSVEPDADHAFKAAAGIGEDQAVIMLLAVGHLPERFRVAKSARRPLDDVLIHI